ncbi:hypothetical protein H0H93_013036 [Arthromyces matolae]|nr:hypothetical protein H0H93_013036 [Arthromyces matolae]
MCWANQYFYGSKKYRNGTFDHLFRQLRIFNRPKQARVNVSQYSSALETSLTDPFNNIYTTNASAPLGVQAGLRYYYDFGLYSYCAYLNDSQGICGNQTIGAQYRPYDAITSDMGANFSKITQALVQDTDFQSSNFLGDATKAAYWMLLLGTLCALLASLTGFLKNHFTFFLSTIFSVSGTALLLIGASIWTIMIKKSEVVNDILIGTEGNAVPIGIVVTVQRGLYLTWAAVSLFAQMRASFKNATLAVAFATLTASVQALPKITRSGRYLYSEDGSRFYIKGVAYQAQGTVVASDTNNFGEPSTFIDPLASSDSCNRDIPFLQELGVNARSLITNSIDLALPSNGSIDRLSPSWSTNLLDQYLTTIDAFSQYNNVLAFNVGNEVVVKNGTAVAPYVKAAARDIKAYLKSKSSSALVGYAAIDGDGTFRDPLANYLSCDPTNTNSDSSAIDLYGLNDYAWCGDSSFQTSYAGTFGDFAGYNVAAYLSEFGNNCVSPRPWTEVAAIFSSQMSPVWSGGVAFSYLPASSADGQFGLVSISADGTTVTTGDDFNNLKTQFNQATGPNSPSQGTSTAQYPACPTTNDTFVASTNLPPTPNEAACDCLESSLSCVFTPATSNYSVIVGTLTDAACSFVGQQGGSCDDIGGNGQTGVYGRISGCDPTIKLSYVMSEYYQLTNRNAQSCSFAGNGTVNPLAPTSASAADAAASSCLANPSATFVPSAVSTSGSSSGSGSGSSSSTTTKGSNGAVNLIGDGNAILGMSLMTLVSVASAVWTLA